MKRASIWICRRNESTAIKKVRKYVFFDSKSVHHEFLSNHSVDFMTIARKCCWKDIGTVWSTGVDNGFFFIVIHEFGTQKNVKTVGLSPQPLFDSPDFSQLFERPGFGTIYEKIIATMEVITAKDRQFSSNFQVSEMNTLLGEDGTSILRRSKC